MNCKKAEKFLIDYLYHELPARKVVRIEKHLEVCDRCSKSLESWRSIHLGYQRSVQEPKVSPYLKQKILAAAKEEMRRSPSPFTRLIALMRPAMLLPAFLIVVFGLVLLFRNHETEMAKNNAPAPQPVVEIRKPKQAPDSTVGGTMSSEKKLGSYNERRADGGESGEYKEKTLKDQQEFKENIPYVADELQRQELAKKESDLGSGRRDGLGAKRTAGQSAAPPPAEPSPASPPPPMERSQIIAEQEMAAKAEEPAPASDSADEDLRQSQVFLEQGNLKNAVTYGQTAVKKDKTGSLAAQFYQTGITYQTRGRCYEAITQFNLIQNNYKSYTNMPDVLRRLGECYMAIGQYEDAKKTYQQLQKFAAMREYSDRKLLEIEQKQQAQEQLKSLGYVQEKE